MRLAHYTAFGSIMGCAAIAVTAVLSTATAKPEPAATEEAQNTSPAESQQIVPIKIITSQS